MSTPDIVLLCAFGLSNARSRVWSALRELERSGRVRRGPVVRHVSGDRGRGNYTARHWELVR